MVNDLRQRFSAAVVDDDDDLRRVLRRALETAGYEVLEGANGRDAVELARTHSLDVMVLDVRMPEMNGLDALASIKIDRPEIAVILLTAFIDVRDAVAAIKTGAHDYLEKPIDLDELVVAVDEALGVVRGQLPDIENEVLSLPQGIVAESPVMMAVFREASRVAPTDTTVLIMGASGTGKEVLARYIHDNSKRNDSPMVAVNCAALPENLIESELFGHEKGAFTGAVRTKIGRFEEASGGTLFLDEIGEMPVALQPKLLRVLEGRTARRVGGDTDMSIDVRIVAATNRSLEGDVLDGRFREDLLYRLDVFALHIPPLSDRREDILPLCRRFLTEETGADKRFSPAAQRLLVDYSWPGNVRELRNAVVRSAIISRGSLILPEDLPASIQTAAGKSGPISGFGVLVGDMGEIQKRAILEALEQTGGNKTQAAKLLGISRRNLVYKLRSYGM